MECPHCHSQVHSHTKHCKHCGGAIPSSQHLLEECGLTDPAPATSSIKPSSSTRIEGRIRFARLGDRFIAFVLDTALLFGLFAVADAWVFMRWGALDGNELQLTAASLAITVTLNTTILLLYGWLLEAAFGATLGKVLVGIRIVRTAERGRLSACAIRNVLRIVDGLGFYLVGTAVAACSDARQRIGDICAQTAVIEEKFGIGVRLAAMALWIIVLAGSGWAVPHLCMPTQSVHTRYLSEVVVCIGKTEDSAYLRMAGLTFDIHSSRPR